MNLLNQRFCLFQLDKRKKLEEEAAIKAVEAEANYRSCVDEANDRHRYRYLFSNTTSIIFFTGTCLCPYVLKF